MGGFAYFPAGSWWTSNLGGFYAGFPSAGGGSVNFDFTGGTLPPGITFTRASTGTYTNNTGTLATATTNTPRFNYVGGVANLLIEPAATNLLVQSNNFITTWFPLNGAVITAAQFVSPDGTNNGSNYTSGTGFGAVGQTLTFAAVQYTVSIWQKRITGTSPLQLTLDGVNNGGVATTTTIARYAATLTPAAGSANALFLLNSASTTDVAGIFGAQLETGPVATSYIPTTAATATRAADSATFTIPAGVSQLTYTFSDNSTQVVSVSAGSYTIPTNLNLPNIKSITGGTVAAAVATPTVDNGAGTYLNSVSVSISSPTAGATFCYRTDGTNPAATTPGVCDAGSTTYSTPVVLSATGSLKVIGTKFAFSNSGILSQAYTIRSTPSSWYVSNVGSDANSGVDAAHSWAHAPGMTGATGVAASTTLLAGDTVFLNKGDSWLNTTLTIPVGGNSSGQITLTAYGAGAKPIISAAANNPAITVVAANMGYWTLDGLDLRTSGVIAGIGITGTIYHNYWAADLLPVPNWIIQNCTSNGTFWLSGPNTIVRNNVVDGTANSNPPWGAIIIRAQINANCLIDSNTVSHFKDRGIWVMNGAPNPVVRYNTVHDILLGTDNPGDAIDIDGFNIMVPNGQVYGNLCYNAAGHGIQYENGIGATASYNLIHDCSWGIGVINYSSFQSQPTNLAITYNVMYNLNAGIRNNNAQTIVMIGNTIYNGTGTTPKGFWIESTDANISALTFENNIIAGTWTHPVQVYGSKAIWTAFDYNDIVPNGTEVVFQNASSNSQTLAQIQALGLMAHGITTNPNFKSTVTPDLSLQAGSPAIGTGVNLGATYQQALLSTTVFPTAINLGNQAASWNIGAYL